MRFATSIASVPRRLHGIRLLTLCCGWLALAGTPAHADVKLTLDVKSGDKISDVYTLVAHADSSSGIDKVEFRIDDQLRYTDTSVPYSYDWDTIADTEGPHNVSITAFDSNGNTKRVMLTLVIDNELSLGAEALAQKAQDALQAKDMDTAQRYSRRALKVEPTNLSANRVLASLYAAKLDWNQAIATLEKAKIPDDATDVQLQLATYRMQRALQPANAANFISDFQAISDVRHKIADTAVQQAQAQHTEDKPESYAAIGDALLQAGRYREAAVEYGKCGTVEDGAVTYTNRRALAYVLDGKPTDALRLLKTLQREKRDDAPARAIQGLILLRAHQFQEARSTVQPDLATRFPAALIVTAFAATAQGDYKAGQAAAKEIADLALGSSDAQYALAVASLEARDADRALNRALALAPFQSGPLLGFAARAVLVRNPTQDRLDQALNITDFVLKSEPDNLSAKLLQALLTMQNSRINDAEPLLASVLKEDNTGTDVLMVGAVFARLKNDSDGVNRFQDAIRRQEPDRYTDLIPMRQPLTILQFLYSRVHYRANAFLTLATLFPAETTAAK
jgi:Tfp pilus assembly protein PilF